MYCVFYIGRIRWYVIEGQPEGDDFTLFAVVVGMDYTEYGYISIKEMGAIEVSTGLPELPKVKIMQDTDFKPCQLGDIPDNELQEFLSKMDEED